jgi:hypothetical protein
VFQKPSLHIILISTGIALLFAVGLFFNMNNVLAQNITPTPDRLARPTLPAEPSQADKGAQVYWLTCLPCHGDRGQGLTTEFMETYPVEDRNCWESGCHGKRPYENGFTLPTTVPAVIGEGTLRRFPNAAVFSSYIYAAMPYWRPASLTEEEKWQVTAFLLRENRQRLSEDELSDSNAETILIGTPMPDSTPQPISPSTTYVLWIIAGTVLVILLMVSRQKLAKE